MNVSDWPVIHSKDELVSLVNEIGLLPFFGNKVPGWSLEEHIAPEAWYGGAWTGKVQWPAWEWKGDVAADRQLVYGKFFAGKAGFVSLEWFPDLCNYRRNGYDLDARYEDGLASRKEKELIDHLAKNGSMLSKQLKRDLNYRKGGSSGFDTVVTRLMMQTYLTIVDFEYQRSRTTGEYYGWGVARYDTAEHWWGELCTAAYSTDPETSRERIMDHIAKILPDADPGSVSRLIKYQ